MIKCLPTDVQVKLRSGFTIPSLQQCVEELVLNCIDAGATCVGVRVDLEAFKVQVIDNGAGMDAEDLRRVGNRHHTSKCNSLNDLENNLRFFGFKGEAIASIVSLASLVEISSRARSSVETLSKIFKNGKGLDVCEAQTCRPSVGTTVVVCNFFHNMPVRRKSTDPVLEGERIRQRMEAISLMHPSVSFTLKNDCTSAMMVQLPKVGDTYQRFIQMHGLSRAQKLGRIHYSREQFEVTGYLGREGHYNKNLQYLYVNKRLVLKTQIHKLLNFLLRRPSSSIQKTDSPDQQSTVTSPKQKRNQELHGVYVIDIKCSYAEYDICLEPAKTLIEFKDWDGVLLCVEEAVKSFLHKENLVTLTSQDYLDFVSPQLFGTAGLDQDGKDCTKKASKACSVSALLCDSGLILSSESVNREPHTEYNICQDSVMIECNSTEPLQRERIVMTELENDQREVCNNEFTVNPECNLARTEPLPVTADVTAVEEVHFSEAEEDKGVILIPTISTCDVRSLAHTTQETGLDSDNIEPVHYQGAGRNKGTQIRNKRIGLSNPYLHQNLQHVDLPQMDWPAKCKVTLNTSHKRACSKVDEDYSPVTPPKIPAVVSNGKISLSKGCRSLDKFRRNYGQFGKPNVPLLGDNPFKPAGLPHTDNLVLNPCNPSVSQKVQQQQQQLGVTETESSTGNPLSVTAFTKLKKLSDQMDRNMSLAAKLNCLKQCRTDGSGVFQHLFSSSSLDHNCVSSKQAFKECSNEEKCNITLNAEPIPADHADPQLDERDETSSGDWLHHYDTCVGRTVYVNKVTGLSRYKELQMEDNHVFCSSDVTNMAVSVFSKTGMEFRCYPFQVELVQPFLPKSKAERVLSSGIDDRGDGDESSNSLMPLYSKWRNPVFVLPPPVGLDISSGQADGLAVKIHNILFPYRFSKNMIHSMKVIHQVDKKFLACLINTREEESSTHCKTEGNLLVMLDQHAAHERIRLENLLADSYENDPNEPGKQRLCSSTILPPLEIGVTEEELRLLRSFQAHLGHLGLEVRFTEAGNPKVLVRKVPRCFMEKESNEIRRGRPSAIKDVVEEYLQEQIELLHSTGTARGTLPLTVLKVLASLACHGAIKFNDSLSRDECCSLVSSLSSCQLPFQCAHGRPSIVPLVDFNHLEIYQKEVQKPNLQRLRRMYKASELNG